MHVLIYTTESALSMGLVGGIAGGVGGVLLFIILVMAVLLILLTVHIRKSGSQDISTATTTGEALKSMCVEFGPGSYVVNYGFIILCLLWLIT